MDPGKRKAVAVIQAKWADLPAELLETIYGGIQNPSEIVGFRSVCRSWRSSIPPSPNKLFPLFPRKAPLPYPYYDPMFNASSIYLVRPRSDPSKAWLVSVQEPALGKLVLRHVLTYKEMNGHARLDLEADWIAATQTPIAKFYARNRLCERCHGVKFTSKVVLVRESGSGGSGCSQLVCFEYPHGEILAFRLDLGGSGSGGLDATQGPMRHLDDFVKFKGRIFAADVGGRIYVLDHTNLQLVQATEKLREYIGWTWFRFVVSDGDLYVVWISYKDRNPSACEIYRLKVNNTACGGCSGILSERVEDLGDKVFFMTRNCSFSISGRLLPHPWREGNCVFFTDFPKPGCRCVGDDIEYKHVVFRLGSRTFTKLSDPEGHSYSLKKTMPLTFCS